MKLDIKETGPLSVNTYILKDEASKEAVIIDLGGSFEEIKQELDEQGFKLKYILLTHGHFDHVMGLAEVQTLSPDTPFYMHKADVPHLKNIKAEMGYFNCSGSAEIEADKFIDENSELYIGGSRIKVFYTPGHSAGGLSFYAEGRVFTGDALFCRSIGRTDFYDSDFNTLINSVKAMIKQLPDDTIVYPGHGAASSIINEKKYNEFLK